jgi:hypothetical protein
MESPPGREVTKRILRLLIAAGVILLSVLTVFRLGSAFHPQPVLATIVNLVVVNVQVHDKETGRSITDLRGKDFEIVGVTGRMWIFDLPMQKVLAAPKRRLFGVMR